MSISSTLIEQLPINSSNYMQNAQSNIGNIGNNNGDNGRVAGGRAKHCRANHFQKL